MLNFVICDDNINILTKLSKMLESIFINHSFDGIVSFQSENANDVLNYVKNNHTDVLILDIDLKSSLTGIELAQEFRKTNKDSYIIFSTGHIEYVLQAYKVKTFDFLPKPIVMERLEETIVRLFDDVCTVPEKYLKLGKKSFINQSEINFIKRDGMKLIFYTNDKQYETYSSFNKIEDSLSENFIRCHKSYIANINNITNIESSTNTIIFPNNNECYIGPKYKNNLMEVFNYANNTNSFESFNNRK